MNIVTRLGRWSATHPWRAIGAWLAFAALALAAGLATGTQKLENGALGESRAGYSAIDRAGFGAPAREAILLESRSLDVRAGAFRAALAEVRRAVERLPQAAHVQAPSSTRSPLVAADRRAALVVFDVVRPLTADRLSSLARRLDASTPSISVRETGDISLSSQRAAAVGGDLRRAELVSVPITLVVLVVAFGALTAAVLPVGLALTAVAAAMGLLGIASQLSAIDDATQTVVLLIGMAVGVDYSLFSLVRVRDERRRGRSVVAAVERAAATSGRAVVVSGLTVIAALAGMYLVRSEVFSGIATGTILVVLAAMVGSMTALPAALVLLDRGRVRAPRRRRPLSDRVVERVLRRPLAAAVAALVVLLALAAPAMRLHVSKPSDDALASRSLPAFATLARVRSEFPAAAEPATVVVRWAPGSGAAARAALRRLGERAVAQGLAHRPLAFAAAGRARTARLDLPLTGDGSNAASERAVRELRARLVPATLGRVGGARAEVTGTPAEDVDFTDAMRHATPWVVMCVLGLAFGLLVLAFHSLVVAVKAVVLNLLSVAAAYGVLVLVFQGRWAEPLLGFRSDGAVIAWLPLFLFVVLFGLSMDYHVFILSRIREAVVGGASTEAAIRDGVAAGAGVVTAAAAVMVAVFSIFATLSSLDLKQTGVGLAVAVLLDATVIRGVLLPATMKLLGDWNWYLPRSLSRLPTLAVEGPPPERVVESPAAMAAAEPAG